AGADRGASGRRARGRRPRLRAGAAAAGDAGAGRAAGAPLRARAPGTRRAVAGRRPIGADGRVTPAHAAGPLLRDRPGLQRRAARARGAALAVRVLLLLDAVERPVLALRRAATAAQRGRALRHGLRAEAPAAGGAPRARG